ncbi:hypothetical protein CH373_02470 [Leptospira perolatii]|uniref:Uncharacterized protein n=1 Tax=Leptospira perolatii TaxID=2023191 RepID=A0A2M9ZS46_9LEPT|nr:hypothetical protein [Leptospira perolatii]PJZ71383.1 hypothetical protein CH360_02470 [Leptospira perolatii]PJZ74917.1 hypothetical protein CH373_02470 [Leptospira perolatii]
MNFQYKKTRIFLVVCFILSILPFSTIFAEEDAHYIQPDDFFITKEEFKVQPWIHVYIAKQTTPPSAKTKNEGEFLQVVDGKKVWTKFYYSTHKAVESELKIGTVVIMADLSAEDGYRPPNDKEEARTCGWFIAKITDVSDLYKGVVTVSGGYKILVDSLRVGNTTSAKPKSAQ